MLWLRIAIIILIDSKNCKSQLTFTEIDFCCSKTCCCSLCTMEQCKLADQPGTHCRCYNTSKIICSSSGNFVYKPVAIVGGPKFIVRTNERLIYPKEKLPTGAQIISIPPGFQQSAQHLVPINATEGLKVDNLCCATGNCPEGIKCYYPQVIYRNHSSTMPMPLPLFILACILFVLIILTIIALYITANLYINDLQMQRNDHTCNESTKC